jgi:hypothetical protein
MPFPATFAELLKAGYSYSGSGNCRKCRARILWYRTPNDARIPINPDATTHWSSCPYAKDFKKAKEVQ